MRRGASTTTAAAARISPLIASICAEKLLRSVAGPSSACFCSTPRWAAMRPRSCSTSLPRAASSCSVPMSRSSSSAETGAGTGEAAAEGGDCASTGPASAKSSHAMHAPTPKMRDRIMAPEISRAPGQGQAPRHTIAKLPFAAILWPPGAVSRSNVREAQERRARAAAQIGTPAKARSAAPTRPRPDRAKMAPEMRLSQTSRTVPTPRRSAAMPKLRPSHHNSDPRKTPPTSTAMPGIPADAHLGEDAGKGEDGDGIGDGEGEGRDEGAEMPLVMDRLGLGIARLEQRLSADIEQEQAAGSGEPILIAQHEVAHDGDAEAGDDAEDGVRGGGAETRDEAVCRTFEEGAAHAEHADGTNRQRDNDADGDALQEGEEERGGYRHRDAAKKRCQSRRRGGSTQPGAPPATPAFGESAAVRINPGLWSEERFRLARTEFATTGRL